MQIIPEEFVHKWWHNLDSPLESKSSSVAKALVEVWNDGGNLVLANGWDEFANIHSEKSSSVVVYFKYIGQNQFSVSFYGKDGMEKQIFYDS